MLTEPFDAEKVMTENQIKHMVDRFLWWQLPKDFHPDNHIEFDGSKCHPNHWPVGTNLLDYTQATEMVRHMVEGIPSFAPVDPGVEELAKDLEGESSPTCDCPDCSLKRNSARMLRELSRTLAAAKAERKDLWKTILTRNSQLAALTTVTDEDVEVVARAMCQAVLENPDGLEPHGGIAVAGVAVPNWTRRSYVARAAQEGDNMENGNG